MRINSVKTSLIFQRKLRPNEESEFSAVLKQGREKVGNTGHSILIIPSASLPQGVKTGVGNMLDEEGKKFIDFAKQYWGINYVQLLPEGQYKVSKGNCFLPYSGSALDLGTHLINHELLSTEEFGNLISKEDLQQIVNKNKSTVVNFENVLPADSSAEKVLRKAYEELLKADTPKKEELLIKLKFFSQVNSDWLEPKAIFKALSAKYGTEDISGWNEFDKNLYDRDFVSLPDRNLAIKGIKESELGKEVQFYEFKQFLAENHLEKARKELNSKGIKLSGDVLVGFSQDEVWANPKAFVQTTDIGWDLPALDFESAEGERLLRKKINLFAKRYDGIRIDASWIYASQPLENYITGIKTKREYGSKILDIIDDEIKKVKGVDFNSEDVMHEFVAELEDFNIYEDSRIKPFVDKRNKIYCSNALNSDWENVNSFRKRGWQAGNYVLGTTNHDCIPMKMEYAEPVAREKQAEVLSKILKIPKEKISSLNDFIKAKFAEPMRAKHNMIFFADALSLEGRYKDNPSRSLDYRLKVPESYGKDYFESLQRGEGFNIMDALDKAFVAEGLDKKESALYKKIVKYKKILQESESESGNFGKKWIIAIGLGIGVVLGFWGLVLGNKKRAGNSGSSQAVSNSHQDKI